MSEKCYNYECEYNQPVRKSRTARTRPLERKSSGHCKMYRQKAVQVSGRCMLGYKKYLDLCPELKEDEQS